MQLNHNIQDCGSTGELCELIEAHAEEFDHINVVTAFRKLLQSRRDGVPRGLAERATQVLEAAAMRHMHTCDAQHVANLLHIMAKTRYRPWDPTLFPKLEGRAEALAGTFNSQNVTNMLWAHATMGREPGARLMRELEGRVEALCGRGEAAGRGGTLNTQHVANTLWAYAKMGREPGAGLMRELEGRAEADAGTFVAQDVANTLWAYAKMGRAPGAGLLRVLEGRAEALAGTFIEQNMSNILWAYATMGRKPRAGVMRGLAGRAEALAGTFTTQDVANMLWAFCVMSVLGVPDEDSRWVHKIEQRLVSLAKHACFASSELSQLHQFFVWCDVEKRKQQLEATIDMRVFKEKCRSEFEKAPTAPSTTQRQVSETLRRMGLSVEDEVRCPKSGYSIDMLVSGLGMGGEISSGVRTWAVEVDGPSHFFASKTPTGVTLLKRRHLQLLGHALVSVPYWEWDGFNGLGSEGGSLSSRRKLIFMCDPRDAQIVVKEVVPGGSAWRSGMVKARRDSQGGPSEHAEQSVTSP